MAGQPFRACRTTSQRIIITHLFALFLITSSLILLSSGTALGDAPTAGDDLYRAEVGTTLHKTAVDGVLTNDSDAENDTITAVLATDVSNGTLILNSDGSFTYAHDGSQTISDNFTYQAFDGVDYSNIATVTITIDPAWPTSGWVSATPTEMGMDQIKLGEARDYALIGGGSGFITRGGKLVMSWGSPSQLYDLKSTTKSIGVTVLGLAIGDGIADLNDLAQIHLPGIGIPPQENAGTGWLDDISLLHLATHTAGFDKPGGYIDLLFEPGTTWAYSDGGANWLADVLTVQYGQDLNDLIFDRVLTKLGITPLDLTWRNNNYREDTIDGIKRREFGSGISANVDAMTRIGYLYLRRGIWDKERILPDNFVAQAGHPVSSITGLPVDLPDAYFTASDHYGLLWWNNGDETIEGVPLDAYWSWGLYDSLIIVIPSLDIVAARAGDSWRLGWDGDYAVVEPFIIPIVQSVQGNSPNRAPVLDAGFDQTITLPMDSVLTDASVTDDGLPTGVVNTQWSQVSGLSGQAVFNDAFAVQTTVTFLSAGTYALRLTADDSELSASDEVTVIVNEVGSFFTAEYRISEGLDDAEESSSGGINLTSSDLEIIHDGSGDQTVGIRFSGVDIPAGATIENAYVQFQAEETSSEPTSLMIEGEGIDNAPPFTTLNWNISTRARTTAAVPWLPFAWTTIGQAGADQRTSDISAVIQEIVDHPGWLDGNALVLIITGTGKRVAESYNGDPNGAPLLHVEYIYTDIPPPVNQAPSVDAGGDQMVTLPDEPVFLEATVIDDGLPNPPGVVSTTWSQVSGHGTVIFDDAGAEDTWATFPEAGTYILQLEVDDSELTASDEVTIFVNICNGDFEPDGDVDGSDLIVFAADFGRTNCSSGPLCEGDFDVDGDVDGTDLATFAADFGRTDCL